MGLVDEACVDQKESYVNTEVGVGIGVVGMGAEADVVVGTGTGTGGCDVAVLFCGVDAGMGMG